MKYKDWLIDWLENYVKISVKFRTYTVYRHLVFSHILPFLGEYDLDELSSKILQDFITSLLKSKNLRTGGALSASSVNLIISILKKSIRFAYDLGFTESICIDKIVRPNFVKRK